MANIKTFRIANGMRQEDLAELLGVSRSFISQIESGYSKLPDTCLQTLQSLEGYDHAGLDSQDTPAGRPKDMSPSEELAFLKAENAFLKERLTKTEAEKERYWEMIQKLIK